MRNKHEPDFLSLAIAEPSRRALLEYLRYGRKSVTELVQATQLKQPNVSNHLAKMRQQGIVRAERIGRQVYYSLAMPFADMLLRMHEVAAHPGPETVAALLPNSVNPADSTDHGHASEAIQPDTGSLRAPHNRQGEGANSLENWQQAYFTNILNGMEDQASALVNSMLAQGMDMQTIYLDVFQVSINRIGEMFQQGLTDEAHEHMASAITERMMARIALFNTPVIHTTRRALLGCVAGNWHALGIRMLADGLRKIGWSTLYLGANVPTKSFASIVESIQPDLVVISATIEDQIPELQALIETLRGLRAGSDKHHFDIAIGGYLIRTYPHLAHLDPTDFTANNLSEFIQTIQHRYPDDQDAKSGDAEKRVNQSK